LSTGENPFWGFIVNPYSWVLQKTLAKGFPVGSKEPLRVLIKPFLVVYWFIKIAFCLLKIGFS